MANSSTTNNNNNNNEYSSIEYKSTDMNEYDSYVGCMLQRDDELNSNHNNNNNNYDYIYGK